VCRSELESRETGRSDVIQQQYSPDDNDDHDDDYSAVPADDDDDDVCMYSRPDRPDCVPKIDLSWITDDEQKLTRHRTTRALDHVTPQLCRRNQARRENADTKNRPTAAAVQRRADHVIQDGRRAEVAAKRRHRRRRRHARYKLKLCNHLATSTSTIRPTCTLPPTPRTPRRQIVRQFDTAETAVNDTKKQEVQTKRTAYVQQSDERVCDSENEFSCTTTADCYDVISARDVTVDNASNAGVMQYGVGSITSPATVHVTDDVRLCQNGSSNVYIDAEGFHDDSVVSGPSLTSTARSLAANVTVCRDGGDAACVEQKSAHESSPSLAERLLCAIDCCRCCRLTMTFYRSPPQH